MRWFDTLLARKIEKIRKPYGHVCPAAVLDFHANADIIMKEWADYKNQSASIGIPIDELSDDQKHLNEDKKWNAFFILVYDFINPDALIHFPKTTALATKWKNDIGVVFFSTLQPGKHITPHTGNNHGVLRSQIGIDIEQPEETALRVEEKTFTLKNGEMLTFDDTFIHEAWNNGNANRTVLIVDSIKPFSPIYNIINRKQLARMKKTPYVQTVINRLKEQASKIVFK